MDLWLSISSFENIHTYRGCTEFAKFKCKANYEFKSKRKL